MSFNNWPELLKGECVSITRTTSAHLASFTDSRKWEGKIDLLEEEEVFLSQKERVRRLSLINNSKSNQLLLTVLNNQDNQVISLLEFYFLEKEIYGTNWILKKVKNGLELAYEASELILTQIFTDENVESILFDLPEYRTESASILMNLGFIEVSYYYRLDRNDNYKKMITFKL